MVTIITEEEFRKNHKTKEELIDIAKNNNGICIEGMEFTISYIPEIDLFQITYLDESIDNSIADYYYIIDHFK